MLPPCYTERTQPGKGGREHCGYFAVKLTRSGRRSTGSSETEVMPPRTQLVGRTRLTCFEPLSFDDVGDPITLAEVFANDQEDPGTLAARNMGPEQFRHPIGKEKAGNYINLSNFAK